MIKLNQLLTLDRVACQAPAISQKKLFETVTQLMRGVLEHTDDAALLEQYIARERLGTTAIGRGTAIPHIRSPRVEQPVGALLTLHQGLDFGAADGQRVNIVFAVIMPESAHEHDLQLLAHLAKLLSQDPFRARLRHMQSQQALFDMAVFYDEQHCNAA